MGIALVTQLYLGLAATSAPRWAVRRQLTVDARKLGLLRLGSTKRLPERRHSAAETLRCRLLLRVTSEQSHAGLRQVSEVESKAVAFEPITWVRNEEAGDMTDT